MVGGLCMTGRNGLLLKISSNSDQLAEDDQARVDVAPVMWLSKFPAEYEVIINTQQVGWILWDSHRPSLDQHSHDQLETLQLTPQPLRYLGKASYTRKLLFLK